MTPKERDQQKREIEAQVKKWPARLKRLRNRKTDPLSEAAFCRKYNLNAGNFSRAKNFLMRPRLKKVQEVDKAFTAEGV